MIFTTGCSQVAPTGGKDFTWIVLFWVEKQGEISEYLQSIDPVARKRYLQRLQALGLKKRKIHILKPSCRCFQTRCLHGLKLNSITYLDTSLEDQVFTHNSNY